MSLGKQWRALTPEQRKPYVEEAHTLKLLHTKEFPQYKFSPKKKGKMMKEPRSKKQEVRKEGRRSREDKVLRGAEEETRRMVREQKEQARIQIKDQEEQANIQTREQELWALLQGRQEEVKQEPEEQSDTHTWEGWDCVETLTEDLGWLPDLVGTNALLYIIVKVIM